MNNKNYTLLVGFALIILLPYLLSTILVEDGYHFLGFLINPIDGHSYLAKMQQGTAGEWLFRSNYSSNPGDGVFLFVYYLFLGHIGSLFQVPNILVFHAARIINSIFLFIFLLKLAKEYIDPKWTFWGLCILIFGGGLGWLGLVFGATLSDFKIPEMYPFFSAFTNPHFPLALGLMVWIILLSRKIGLINLLLSYMLSALLLVIQPFCIVIILGVLVISIFIGWKQNLQFKLIQVIGIGCLAIMFGIYLYQITNNHHVINSWNLQNLTPSPPIWDLVLSLSPMIVLACIGAAGVIKMKEDQYYSFITWVILVVFLAYLPINLQRRFFIGLYIPICILGVKGLQLILEKYQISKSRVKTALLLSMILTNIFLVILAMTSVKMGNTQLVMEKSEWGTIKWVEQNIDGNKLILTDPHFGLYIPAYSNHRVFYGHPFETANAEEKKETILSFFETMNEDEQNKFIINQGVDCIITLDEEDPIFISTDGLKFNVVHRDESVKVYAIEK